MVLLSSLSYRQRCQSTEKLKSAQAFPHSRVAKLALKPTHARIHASYPMHPIAPTVVKFISVSLMSEYVKSDRKGSSIHQNYCISGLTTLMLLATGNLKIQPSLQSRFSKKSTQWPSTIQRRAVELSQIFSVCTSKSSRDSQGLNSKTMMKIQICQYQ